MNNIIDDYKKIINLGQLLSQPLISTLEADFYTAQRFVDFMTEYGLEKVDNVPPLEEGENAPLSEISGAKLSGPLKLKMVTFLYRQIDPSDRQEKLFRVQVPLISLIPLPLLQIERAEFDFNLRIFAEVSLTSPAAREGGLKNLSNDDSTTEEVSFKGFKARLSPTVGRSESGEIIPTVDANMKVKVQMKQADLPGGLAYWMSAFNQATSISKVEEKEEEVAQLDAEDESSQPQSDEGSDSPASE